MWAVLSEIQFDLQTALVLVSLIAVTLATAYPPRRNKNKNAIQQPVQPASTNVKKHYISRRSYDVMRYASESAAPYYQEKKRYNVQSSYDVAGSNYDSVYQKPEAYGGYPSYWIFWELYPNTPSHHRTCLYNFIYLYVLAVFYIMLKRYIYFWTSLSVIKYILEENCYGSPYFSYWNNRYRSLHILSWQKAFWNSITTIVCVQRLGHRRIYGGWPITFTVKRFWKSH